MGLLRLLGQIVMPIARLTFSPDDTPDKRMQKQLLTAINLDVLAVSTLYNILLGTSNGMSLLRLVTGTPALMVVSTVSMIHMLKTKSLSTFHIGCFCLAGVASLFLMDWRTYGKFDIWALSVLAMDILLLCSCEARYSAALRALTIVYLIFDASQQITHSTYGVVADISELRGPVEKSTPSEMGLVFVVRVAVFVLDFLMTQFFCRELYRERERLKASIELTQQVTASLVAFDLAEADEVLEKSPPSEQKEVLEQLLRNLHSYRPYLPDALFSEKPSLDLDHYRLPPEGKVALVFTDVQSSTATWEVCPKGMRKAMETHNRIIRECIATYNGYEVKTIGDAFMVAFDSSAEACLFGLEVQGALYESDEWSAELLAVPQCSLRQGMWNGLRVRIGVHVGDAVMEINPVTGRGDYVGTTVNIASRVEGAAWSGTVAVTKAVLQSLGGKGLEDIGSPASLPLGEMSLRGVGDPLYLFLLVPRLLEGRLNSDPLVSSSENSPSHCISLRTESMCSSASRASRSPPALQLALATVACVRIDHHPVPGLLSLPHFTINDILAQLIDSAERMRGQMATFFNSSACVTWNAARPCVSHALQGVLFAERISSLRQVEGITVGVASGPVLHGPVGSATQKFIVDIGQPVDLAVGLAAAAADLGTFVLIGAVPDHSCLASDPAYSPAMRKVDEWELHNGRMDVLEVDVARVFRCEGNVNEQWGWSPAYEAAYSSGNIDELRSKAEEDPILETVAGLLTDGRHLQRPFLQRVHA